jgi:hypothetical protein
MPYAYDSVRMLIDGFESDEGVAEYMRNLTTTTVPPVRSPASPAAATSGPSRSSGS